MVWKGKLTVFESSNISETRQATPTKIGVHAFGISPYLHKFFEPIPINKFFDDHVYSMVGKGNLAVFESSNISKIKKATPTKTGVHACYIKPYLHEFLELIPIN